MNLWRPQEQGCANKSVPAIHLWQDGGGVKLLHQGGVRAHLGGPPATQETNSSPNKMMLRKGFQGIYWWYESCKTWIGTRWETKYARMILTECDVGCGWLDSDQPHQHRLRARQYVQQCPHSRPSFVCCWGINSSHRMQTWKSCNNDWWTINRWFLHILAKLWREEK